MPQIIIHVDMDAFYASVEIRDNPALKGNVTIGNERILSISSGEYISSEGKEETVEGVFLPAGETITIDGRQGKVTTEGQNAFDRVSFWQFPRLEAGENVLTFSDPSAKVKITYTPMWL